MFELVYFNKVSQKVPLFIRIILILFVFDTLTLHPHIFLYLQVLKYHKTNAHMGTASNLDLKWK